MHNKIGTNKTLLPCHLFIFLSQISKHSFYLTRFKSVSTKEIINIIKSLKSNNSHVCEEVSTKLLKISAPYICSPLMYICGKSVSLGIFPDCLTLSLLTWRI